MLVIVNVMFNAYICSIIKIIMKELSTREKINFEYEWYEKHRLKVVSHDPDVQKMLDTIDIEIDYEFPPLRIRYPRSNFED